MVIIGLLSVFAPSYLVFILLECLQSTLKRTERATGSSHFFHHAFFEWPYLSLKEAVGIVTTLPPGYMVPGGYRGSQLPVFTIHSIPTLGVKTHFPRPTPSF